MACLRQMNNNPRVFSSASRPIVEFAVEDARLKRKMDLKAKGRKHRGTDGGLAEGTVVNKAEKKKLWKNKLRDKITERKQKKQQGGAGNEPAGGVAKPGPEAEAAKKEPSKAASGNKRKAAATGDQALKKAKPANRANGKMTGKGKGGKHGDKDVGTAKEAIRAAKARRVQAQAVEEESHSTRKRKQEELIDKLANSKEAHAPCLVLMRRKIQCPCEPLISLGVMS